MHHMVATVVTHQIGVPDRSFLGSKVSSGLSKLLSHGIHISCMGNYHGGNLSLQGFAVSLQLLNLAVHLLQAGLQSSLGKGQACTRDARCSNTGSWLCDAVLVQR